MRGLYWLLGSIGAAFAAFVYVSVEGLVVVRDTTGEVASAVVVSGEEIQRLYRLPGGYFVTIPRLEGVVEIRCHDGSTDQQGYVTGHMDTRVKVAGNTPCNLVDDP